MIKISSWGRLSRDPHMLVALADRERIATQLEASAPGISFGMGRSYGDVCLNPGGTLWQTTDMNRFISFDDNTGILHCEAGVLLRDIQQHLVPRGWMLPVTPGTQLITVGGAIANDIHGKNHHVMGTFGEHVRALSLQRTDGECLECVAGANNKNMLRATIGGLGLTGVIRSAHLQLRKVDSAWLNTDTVPFNTLDDFFSLAAESEADWEHTVSWIDCLAGPQTRGIFLRANHAAAAPGGTNTYKSRSASMPFTPPISLVNRLSLRPFNASYYAMNTRKAGPGSAHYEQFFYPLDGIQHWNRMYGRKGFYQYQCVIPQTNAKLAVADMLRVIADSGEGSFLAVLKTFSDRPAAGLLSFPCEGATLALDFPNKGQHTENLFLALDAIVSSAGGRLYAAKDARMSREMFQAGYPALEQFNAFRDPGISSAMSRRLLDG